MKKLVVKMVLGCAVLGSFQEVQAQDPLSFKADFTLGDMGDGQATGVGRLWPTLTTTD